MTKHVLSLTLCLLLFGSGFLSPAVAQEPIAGAEQERQVTPRVSFATRLMQSAQLIRTESDGLSYPADDAEFGFHRVRFNLEVNAELHERVSAFVDLGHEPNDFGDEFAPVVDYVALDVDLNDALILRLGTPVTGLFNFRGYTDGAAVQSNPLIGNTPIDFVTAETGIALVFDNGTVGGDLTVTSPTFFETFAPGTGFTIIGKLKFIGSETFKLGGAVALGTNGATLDRNGFEDVNFIRGDGENYNLPIGQGRGGQPNRYTHAYLLPGASPFMVQLDAQITSDPVLFDVWGGFGTEGNSGFTTGMDGNVAVTPLQSITLNEDEVAVFNFTDEFDSTMWWVGGTAKVDVSDNAFLAARGTMAQNASDWASDLDETTLWRVQAGIGFTFFERAMLKFEFVHQNEGINSPGQIGENWTGGLTEFSIGF